MDEEFVMPLEAIDLLRAGNQRFREGARAVSEAARLPGSILSEPATHRLASQGYHVQSTLSVLGIHRWRNGNSRKQARRASRC